MQRITSGLSGWEAGRVNTAVTGLTSIQDATYPGRNRTETLYKLIILDKKKNSTCTPGCVLFLACVHFPFVLYVSVDCTYLSHGLLISLGL
jgi:hypothetical protein